jgi:hypothetical protein
MDTLINHIRAMCNHDAADEAWVLDWMAGMLTHPNVKPEQALAVVGPGGKKTFAEIVKRVVGLEKAVTTSNLKSLFNAELENKILVHYTEPTRFEIGPVESLLSDPEISIRAPKRDPIVVPSYHRVLLTSNAPVSGELGELRRIRQVVSRAWDWNHAVWAAIDDDGAIQELRAYLLAR